MLSTPSSPGVAPKGLKSTGTAEFNKVWSYLRNSLVFLFHCFDRVKMACHWEFSLIGDRYDDHRFLGVANWLEKECNN